MTQSELYLTLLAQIRNKWSSLPDKPDETPEETLRVLWLFASGIDFSLKQLDETTLPELAQEDISKLKSFIDQRVTHAPLAYLIGRQLFMGLEFGVKPDAMIPRKETEILGRVAVDTVREIVQKQGEAFVLDVCTGSGNLALSMAYYEPGCRVVGTDLSEGAIALARQNAAAFNLEPRVQFIQGDLFTPMADLNPKQVDLIVCNPPYLSSARVDREPEEIKDFEPRLAFDGGPFGVNVLTRVVREAYQHLKPGSLFCIEIGLGQGKAIARLLESTGRYTDIQSFYDPGGEVRVLRARTIPAMPA